MRQHDTNTIKRSPGLLHYMTEYDPIVQLSSESFFQVAKQMISNCNSDAFVFVNMPGITKLDFSLWSKGWQSLFRYVQKSSTALKFEKVEVIDEQPDLFERLMDFTANRCHVQDKIIIRGNITEDYDPYIDARPRIIRIDFPALPVFFSPDGKSREEVISDYDKFLRQVLAQIPSPRHTVLVTSLETKQVPQDDEWIPLEIFPQIFDDSSRMQDTERNENILDIKPSFNTPRPKYSSPPTNYLSVFDDDFIEKNYQILRLISITVVCSISLHLIFYFQSFRSKSKNTSEQSEKS